MCNWNQEVTLPNNKNRNYSYKWTMLFFFFFYRLNILNWFLPICQLLIAVEMIFFHITSLIRSVPSPALALGQKGWEWGRERDLLSVRSELPTEDTRRDNRGRGHSETSQIKLGFLPADMRTQRSNFARGHRELTANVIPLIKCQTL